MEQHMEQPQPTFISRERREHIEFYQDWVRTAFIDGLAGLDSLLQLRDRFTLTEDDLQAIKFRGLDMELLAAPVRELQAAIEAEVADAVSDLQQSVFDAQLFQVAVVLGEDVGRVESVQAAGELVVPVINGEPYYGAIDDVLFDR